LHLAFFRLEPSREVEISVCERLRPKGFERPTSTLFLGATATPRKTNYDFERREREKNKAADAAAKAKAKADKKAFETAMPNEGNLTDR
jgi:hypothetical protein